MADLTSLARDGVLRAAINTGNRALVQADGDTLSGVSPALARRLADEIGARLEPVIYEGAGKVFADADAGAGAGAGARRWDVGFLAVDAKRAERVAFTRPYVSIEATYAVRAGSAFTNAGDVDRADISVLTALGSAYDMHLTRTLEYATLERLGTPPESFAAFRDGRCDAVAGVRQSLEAFFAGNDDVRILPGALTAVHQAMVLPGPDHPVLAALDDFVARAIADGFVARET